MYLKFTLRDCNLVVYFSMRDMHRKKLEKIREERKTQLGFDHSRFSQHEALKESKTKTFIHKVNQQNEEITR